MTQNSVLMRPGTRFEKRSKIYLIYFLLAFFDIATVSISLFLNHQLMIIYTDSVEVNQDWSNMSAQYSTLTQLAMAVNAPGNDIFDSHDVSSESARMDAALISYRAVMSAAQKHAIEKMTPQRQSLLLSGLKHVDRTMDAMVEEASRIFSFFENKLPEQAGQRMATMDRKYADVLRSLNGLREQVAFFQRENFEDQMQQANNLRKLEYLIGAFIIFMVCAVAIYGRALSRRIDASESARQTNEIKLQAAVEETSAANADLEAFTYSVAHDLRAPLRHLNGLSEALQEDYSSVLDDTGNDYLKRIQASSRDMGHLIDALIRFSRLQQIKIDAHTVDLSTMAAGVVNALQEAEPNRSVSINIHPDLSARGDLDLLNNMLTNLIGNAWKYTSKHETAQIEFGILQDSSEPTFFVRDDGAGFDMRYATKLFQPFHRIHASSEFEGIGIGLSLVERIIHRHGGRIWVESAIENGTTFYFTLPETHDI